MSHTWECEEGLAEAERLLAIALAKLPNLGTFGMGVFGGPHDDRCQKLPKFIAYRAELSQRLDEIAAAAAWLRTQGRLKTINSRRSSYSYKHMVEDWCREVLGEHRYVSNGAFIAAAVGLGVPYRLDNYNRKLLRVKYH